MARMRRIAVTTAGLLCSALGCSGGPESSPLKSTGGSKSVGGRTSDTVTGGSLTGGAPAGGTQTGGEAPAGGTETGGALVGGSPTGGVATGGAQLARGGAQLTRGGGSNGGLAGTIGGNPTVTGGGSTVGGTTMSAGGGGCVPQPCASDDCGPVPNGCGALMDCPVCLGICGLQAPSKCYACTPTTCAAKGANCGPMSDGCGQLLDCGTCPAGSGDCGLKVPNICGDTGVASPVCPNFCQQQVTCTGGVSTTLTGTVLAPNGTLPLPNALVYVPNGSMTSPYGVEEFVDGVANNTGCECNVTGNPLVIATTAVDGSFTLTNVPAGTNIPLVIQLGRWRRMVTIANVPQCTTTPVPATLTRLPTRQDEGSPMDAIPLMALTTGNVDGMECVLRKMGVEDGQFTAAGGSGRIRFYRDNGASIGTATPAFTQLVSSQAEVDQYDALIFPCRGSAHDRTAAQKRLILDVATNAQAYVNKGGRAFFTHFSYSWLYGTDPSNQLPWLSTTNTGNVDGTHWDTNIAVQVNTAFPRGLIFSQWLALPAVGALSAATPPQIQVLEARENMHTPLNLPITTAQEWLTTYQITPTAALHVTFDAPWGVPPADQCGRVLWSGFHVTADVNTGRATVPEECTNTEFSAQEKVLAYMMFDMTSCLTPPPPCTPLNCLDQAIVCGPAGDGCGGTIDCGPCQCVPTTCEAAGVTDCASIPDGCGGLLRCGAC
jgi:hypothetical protein